MAIEIRELIIRVTLHNDDLANRANPATPPAPALPTAAAMRQMQQDVTQDCVRQVLAELERQRER